MLSDFDQAKRGARSMTMMSHLVIRLHGDEDWEAWGDAWGDHVGRVGERAWAHGWVGPAVPLSTGVEPRTLDWGAKLYEATAELVRKLAWEPSWMAQTETTKAQRRLLAALSDDERYGVVFVEGY
jgi:hypothetical protein